MADNRRATILLISILALIWGSSFILMKRGLDVYTPAQVGAVRVFSAFLCVFPFVVHKFRQVERSRWKFLFLTGMLGNGIPAILFPLAETNISSSVAGMINAMTPLFTMMVGFFLFGMPGGRNRVAGLIIGLIGTLILVGGKNATLENGNPWFAGYIVLATICYAFSVNILRYRLADMGSIMISGFALMFAGIPMGIYLFSGDFISRTQEVPGAAYSLGAILILGIFSTAISTVLFNRLIKMAGALSASSVTYLIPIVAMIWGFYDKENLGLIHIFGLSGILLGVYLINIKR
ncbi:MAG TPA: EamA family transporter [Bacteroidia bacterium]|nr:EamA family transporter [Bacteroidia bacterium]HNS11781.1 EamA family transporter [Bacteroidia bacterium]